ncbi:hypothetical protein [Nostoc sp. UHCC 0251]|uniref:hypothetical protein n=1 Tax=Nostoc sp. UHCC 0251 TaxID=3110240 RepID=UPI002B201DAF|nr:hypothetical protein [Nostoc sp. UHCC 0251]MEA5624752.1 hypothetical protein [Nostoc sp. UHCC 0251]
MALILNLLLYKNLVSETIALSGSKNPKTLLGNKFIMFREEAVLQFFLRKARLITDL